MSLKCNIQNSQYHFMEVNPIRTKYAISVVFVITILFVTVFVVNDSFATSMSLSKTGHQDQAVLIQSAQNEKPRAIQDNEDLEAKGASDDNMFEAEADNESKAIDFKSADADHITSDHAKFIAVGFISANTSDVKSISLEGESGNPIYSVDITKNGQNYEMSIDAINGNVLFVSQDSADVSVSNTSEIGDGDSEMNDD